ncbi:MAG: CaiB/BaiF CoA transferase family protein [Thermoanaerobaculia bacterium]
MPLRGIRVVDFTRHLPGPYATDILRRLGAEVIKIEPPEGDPTRWLPPFDGDYGALFTLVNAGKESVVVDLKSDEGRRFVHALIAHADVAVESYKPGVTQRFGIDVATLLAINPRLVYCSLSGYGAANARSSHDLNFVALAGLLDLQRDRSGRPVLPATQLGDMGGALFAALAILAALLERQRTGEGKSIDISMSDGIRALMPTAEALYRGTHHTPESFMLTGALPNYDVYETADGKYIAIAALEPHFWKRFCEAIGHPELIAKQYTESARPEIRATVTAAIVAKTRDAWERVFSGLDVCVEPVLSIEEAHERFGDPMLGHPLQTNFPHTLPPAPKFGGDFEKVARIAGFDDAAIRELRASGHFERKEKLQQFITTTALKFRERLLRRKRES